MGKPTSSLATEANALREAHAAFNRGDVPAFVRIFDPQVEWIDPAEVPGAGTYRGLDAVQAHLAESRESWAEGSCEPERVIVAGGRILQLVRVRVRLKEESEWREGQVTEVYTFRDGKVIEVRLFAESRQALAWAGVKASEVS